MLYCDSEIRRQLAGERAAELAREYRLAQAADGDESQRPGSRRRSGGALLSRLDVLRREARERAVAYRA